MYNNKCMCYNIIAQHLLFQSTLIGGKSPARAQSTILLDNATEISSEVQFPTNKKTHKQDVGMTCQKVCKQGRDDSMACHPYILLHFLMFFILVYI